MPHLPTVDLGDDDPEEPVFPPVTKDHIQNCSYDSWYPKYRSSTIKSRIIPLSPELVSYLHEDGIILADDDGQDDEEEDWQPTPTSRARVEEVESDDEEEETNSSLPPNQRFPETHRLIQDKIAELGGAVVPKLNWSSPKDAKWISNHQNTLKCTNPNDIYLLLKSSSFVSHDLSHAFDECTSAPASKPFAPVLVLRPFFSPHPALEFRCFVKHRNLVGITQRDLNHYDFLAELRPKLQLKIKKFFDSTLKFSFPDSSFTFDVYISESYLADDGLGNIKLIDINPWAPKTDSLLFGWKELLDMEVPRPLYGSVSQEDFVDESSDEETDFETEDEESPDGPRRKRLPEMRILEKDDPAAFNFSSPQYSAHKLPKEVVDASAVGGGGLREFLTQWRNLTEGRGDGIWEQAAGQPGSST